jgi:flagellar assembly factor FliW
MTVPSDLTKMTCNLKAPIIINTATMKAVQAVAANEDYVVRFPVYNLLKERKEKAGE